MAAYWRFAQCIPHTPNSSESAEVDSRTRPVNSLLQEDVTFDVVARPGASIERICHDKLISQPLK